MSNTSKNHIAIPIAPLSNNQLNKFYNVNNLLTPKKNGNNGNTNARNNKNALLTPSNYNASLNVAKNGNNSLKINVKPSTNNENDNYLATPVILTPSNYNDLLTPNANYYSVNRKMPLKNSNGNNNGTRKIKFNPNANVREYMSNNPFTIHQGPKSNTAKKWKNKGSPKIYKRVPNSWNEKVAHLAAMVHTKNTRNNMIQNLKTNPYVNSVIRNYYDEEIAKEREQNKRFRNRRRNNNSVNTSSNNSNNSNFLLNEETMNIYKNDMIKDVIDHLNQKNRVSNFN